MARPPKKAASRRDRRTTVRFTEAEHLELQAKAAAAGLDLAELLRRSAFALRLNVRKDRIGPRAVYALNKLGVNLNQAVKIAHFEGLAEAKAIAEIAEEVRSIVRGEISRTLAERGK